MSTSGHAMCLAHTVAANACHSHPRNAAGEDEVVENLGRDLADGGMHADRVGVAGLGLRRKLRALVGVCR